MYAEVTPTINTAAYTAADQVGGIQTIDFGQPVSRLKTVSIVDKAKQKAEMIILFFKELPTVASSNNAALDISDAEMAAKFIAKVTVAAADYTDISASSAGTKECDLSLQSKSG